MINSNATSKFPQQHSDDGVKTLSKLLPVAIVIVLANGLVFVLFYRCRRLRTSSSFCDFAKRIELWDILLAYITSFSGAYHILVITALKYLATVRPLKHHVVTKGLVLKILFGIWIM